MAGAAPVGGLGDTGRGGISCDAWHFRGRSNLGFNVGFVIYATVAWSDLAGGNDAEECGKGIRMKGCSHAWVVFPVQLDAASGEVSRWQGHEAEASDARLFVPVELEDASGADAGPFQVRADSRGSGHLRSGTGPGDSPWCRSHAQRRTCEH